MGVQDGGDPGWRSRTRMGVPGWGFRMGVQDRCQGWGSRMGVQDVRPARVGVQDGGPGWASRMGVQDGFRMEVQDVTQNFRFLQ